MKRISHFSQRPLYLSLLIQILAVCMAISNQNVLSVHAQVIMVPEGDSYRMPRIRPTPVQPEQAYRVRELSIDTSIQDQLATTQVTQTFENTLNRQIESSFVFPIPYEGAVSEMTFLVDGKEYPGKLLDAKEARKIYEGYVRRNQDPALLEWVGFGMFRTSVFPIPAGATRTVTLKYTQLLRQDHRLTDYLFPLSTARYTSRPLEKLMLRVAISSENKIGNIYSPTHQVDVQRDDEFNAVVTHSSTGEIPSSDFRLFFDNTAEKLGVSLLSYWPEDEETGYFILLASPQIEQNETDVVQKTVIFVVDQSGSMAGQKIQQAREAAKFIVNNLREDDLFNIISYDSVVKTMSPELLRFNSQTRSQAIGFVNSINAGGMTNIKEALDAAMGLIQTDQMPTYVLFMTDGMPTVGETNELKIAEACRAANKHRARVINLGVGYDVNSRLLDRLARENNGQTEYVTPEEDLEAVTAKLYSKISAPVLAKVNIEYLIEGWKEEDGTPVDQLYPAVVSDLFAGGQVVIVGRYRTPGSVKIKISGEVGKESEVFQFDAALAEKQPSQEKKFVAQLWASRRIGEIIDLIDLHGRNEELIAELVSLSKKHGILTPYTAYLADDQADQSQLTQIEQLNRLTEESIRGLEITGGRFGFEGRGGKQFLIQNQIASPSAQNQQMASRYNAMQDAGGMAGGGGALGGSGVGVREGIGGQIDRSGIGSGRPAITPLGGGRTSDQQGQSDIRSQSGLRQAGSVTIYVRGKNLIADNALDIDLERDIDQIQEIERFTEDYFELITTNSPDENLIMSQQMADEQLLVKLRGKTYLIK